MGLIDRDLGSTLPIQFFLYAGYAAHSDLPLYVFSCKIIRSNNKHELSVSFLLPYSGFILTSILEITHSNL
jgi:hypothetical protein